MDDNKSTEDLTHLKNKIEIIYKYNPSFVPEYQQLETIHVEDKVMAIYQNALKRAEEESTKQQGKIISNILPLFDQLQHGSNQLGAKVISNLLLTSIKGTIEGHLVTLQSLPHCNEIEQECLNICQEIMGMTKDKMANFFPLFKRYLILLSEHNAEITAPLTFADPTTLVTDVCREATLPLDHDEIGMMKTCNII